MTYSIENAVDDIRQNDDFLEGQMPLPTDQVLDHYEKNVGITFPDDYRFLLKEIGNVVIGDLQLLVCSDPQKPTRSDLLKNAKDGWRQGLPSNWLPICEDNGDFYCLTSSGMVVFWSHEGAESEQWDTLAVWVRDVFLDF